MQTDRKLAVVVSDAPETLAQRVQRLQGEARVFAREHEAVFAAALAEVARLAGEIATGGGSYSVGVQEIARRLGPACEADRRTIQSITGRSGR